MAGTINIALAQQMDANGIPLRGCLLYLFQVGTVATPQNAFSDVGLTQVLPWPVVADDNGRLPMFYLADGAVHARLTDRFGQVQFDYPNMLVVGPSSSSGGGGGSVDPTSVATTGDVKFRPTAEVLAGWIKLNGLTIGNASSGASQRANNDTQALFVYNWTNFSNVKCPVTPAGRGVSALADFAANKQLQLLDLRSFVPTGLDGMGNTARGLILSGNVTSGGGDTPDTPAAFGGEANHTLTLSEVPAGQLTLNDPTHFHEFLTPAGGTQYAAGGGPQAAIVPLINALTTSVSTGITLTDHAGGGRHNTMQPFILGTFYQKLAIPFMLGLMFLQGGGFA